MKKTETKYKVKRVRSIAFAMLLLYVIAVKGGTVLQRGKRGIICGIAVMLLCGGCGDTDAAFSDVLVDEEHKLVLYTSHKEEVYGPIVKEFEERTGIWVQVKTGGTTELLDTIAEESGEQTCDVMFGGGVESYAAYSTYFEPYQCRESEMLDTAFLSSDGSWTVFSELPIVFVYNNKLVTQEEAPESWQQLLDGDWRGRIAFADPGSSGTSCTALATMCQVLKLSPEELAELFGEELDGDVSPNSGSVITEVNEGTKLIGITLEETALKAIRQGADLSMVYPTEGTSAVPDGSAIVKNAPHAENARLFIDFTVSRDVQRMVEDEFCRRTVRTDLQESGQEEELKTIAFDLEWAGENQKLLLSCWKEQLGEEQQEEEQTETGQPEKEQTEQGN